jgi:carboxymethylenebutenolidase
VRLNLGQRLAGVGRLLLDGLGNAASARPRACGFESSGQPMRAWLYRAGARAPGVLLLHTAWGLSGHERAFARRLARIGFACMVVSYAAMTTGEAVLKDTARRQFLEGAAADALAHLRVQPEVDPSRVAVVGFSLGGHFALHLAAGRTPPDAVVVYYGVDPTAERLVPTITVPLLVLQGGRDDESFVQSAGAAARAAAANGRSCELVTYPEAVHQFDLFQPRGRPARDAWERTCAFIGRHLRGNAAGGPTAG